MRKLNFIFNIINCWMAETCGGSGGGYGYGYGYGDGGGRGRG